MQYITPLAPAYAEVFLLCMVCVILLVDLFLSDEQRGITYALTLATLGGCFLLTGYSGSAGEPYTFSGMFVADLMANVLKLGVYIAVAMMLAYSQAYIRARGMFRGEFFVLTLFAVLGMMVMASANHLLTLYLGLELLSLSLYAMVALQRDSHGFVSGALFLCVGVMYERVHSRQIADYGGVVNKMPVFAALFMLFAMANSGLPGTSGFVGEWLVILASMKVSFWTAAAAGSTLIFGAAYTLWMYKRVVFGAVANPHVEELTDIGKREMFVLGVLAALVLGMGLYPAPLGEVLHESVNEILRLAAPGRKLLMGF